MLRGRVDRANMDVDFFRMIKDEDLTTVLVHDFNEDAQAKIRL